MTKDKLQELVNNIIKKLNNFKFNIKVSDINNILTFNSPIEAANIKIINKHNYLLLINEKLLVANKKSFLINTICHELCHIIQFNEVFDANIIDFNQKTSEFTIITANNTLVINTVFDDNFHSLLWLDIAREVSKLLKLNHQIKAYLSEVDIDTFLKEFFMQIPKKIKSPIIIKDKLFPDYVLNDPDFALPTDKIEAQLNEEIDINKLDLEKIHSYRKLLKDKNK